MMIHHHLTTRSNTVAHIDYRVLQQDGNTDDMAWFFVTSVRLSFQELDKFLMEA